MIAAWQLFLNPVQMGQNSLFLVLPLCAAVAVAYKTVRVENLRQLPRQILVLWAEILVGLAALAAVFYLLLEHANY